MLIQNTISLKTALLGLIFCITIYSGCDRSVPTRLNRALTILPLGDSRVSGNRPAHESYRYELWKILVEQQVNIDFVGTRTDLADYPSFLGIAFDTDHEGTGGATSWDNYVTLLEEYNSDNAPDIVLFGVGGNDLTRGGTIEGVISNLTASILHLRSINPDIDIFIEKIAPGKTDFMTPAFWQLHEDFVIAVQDLANQASTIRSLIVPIDMHTDWNDDYMADNVHYNERGAKKIADKYWSALQLLLN